MQIEEDNKLKEEHKKMRKKVQSEIDLVRRKLQEEKEVMEDAMNFLRTPRGRHIRVDSVMYDGNDPFGDQMQQQYRQGGCNRL